VKRSDHDAVERVLAGARIAQANEDHLPEAALVADTAEARSLCARADETLGRLLELLGRDHVGGWVRMSVRPVEAITETRRALHAIAQSLPWPPARGGGRPPRGWRTAARAELMRLGLPRAEARRITTAEALRRQ